MMENERIRQQQLGSAYGSLVRERHNRIHAKLTASAKFGSVYSRGFHDILIDGLISGFSSKQFAKPSEFYEKNQSWIFDELVYPRFRRAFLAAVDGIRDYPYAVSFVRRGFRSPNYRDYTSRISMIFRNFWLSGYIDADICDILTGNLPDGTRAYLRTKKTPGDTFVPEVLAYELDQDNPGLEQIVTDIINGDNSFASVSHALIRGIVMSHNERMHQLLCRLLLAARLQEGLRQAICESADYGTREAFLAILTTIQENNLIRFSSVKRAVGTWLGLISEETRDLDRVSCKSVELIFRCLQDSDFRKECLESEDAMQIYIALWSHGFDSIRNAMDALQQISTNGTHHQVLTAGYFVANLNNRLLQQTFSRTILTHHRERNDILAVYIPQFLFDHRMIARNLINDLPTPDDPFYFTGDDEAREFCDWLLSVHGSLRKKELVFDPCIFPWNKAVLKKSDLVEKAMVIAVRLQDQERIDRLCSMIGECDAFGRDLFFKLLTMGKETPSVRNAILRGLADKNAGTRHAAMLRCKERTLTADEYLEMEEMLRLRYDDLRCHVMELLMKQPDDALSASIRRLLGASRTEKRTAGLDMLNQIAKQEERKAVLHSCLAAVSGMTKTTTQEKILIDTLTPKAQPAPKILFSEQDRYQPVIEVDDFARKALRVFTDFFPDSKLGQQVLLGERVPPKTKFEKTPPCPEAVTARNKLKSLSDFFVANENEHFTNHMGESIPISRRNAVHFWLRNQETGELELPRMDLWEQWLRESAVTAKDLMGMYILVSAQNPNGILYLNQCGGYISDLYGAGFEAPVGLRYMAHMLRILQVLLLKSLTSEQRLYVGGALGLWIAKCLPDEMLLGDSGKQIDPKDVSAESRHAVYIADKQVLLNTNFSEQTKHNPAGHFIGHPQIAHPLFWLRPDVPELRKHIIPIALNIYERTFESSARYMKEKLDKPVTDTITIILKQLYHTEVVDLELKHYWLPDVSTYLFASHHGLISDNTLYYHLMQPGHLKKALELTTSVCAIHPAEGDAVSSKAFSGYRVYHLRRQCENFIGKGSEYTRDQLDLIELCRRTAKVLVDTVVDPELCRGDSPAPYSKYVTGIQSLSGAKTFVRILTALGKESLDRTVYYYYSAKDSKKGNLSYLLSRCAPSTGDTAETLRELLRGTDVSRKRLIEAALYCPEWIDIIGEYLNIPGFKSACYYFMAHMNEQFDDQKKAIIARFTPLTDDELNMGAFDVDWFRSAYAQLGEQDFEIIYDAAKYISEGSKHTRARKFADAALGKLDIAKTEETVKDKRNKDLLMAYAIIPLNGEDDLIHRYLYIQQFLKESRQFGAQRSASEKKAVEAALRNLATNAGFSDTMRLTLRMETKLVADNADLFMDTAVGEWRFRLEIDHMGAASILCSRDGKPLKSVPSKAKKEPHVIRLTEMKKLLTDQYRRTRRMFEQAMEEESTFRMDELRELFRNRVVAPIVSKLVFKSGTHLGFFDGENLISISGDMLEDSANTELIVAHPVHLYESGQWRGFQQHLFDNRITQPFRQVFRELYVKTAEEQNQLRSLRYAGNQIQPRKAAACLKDRRWIADMEMGLQKVYYRENIVATIFALADWFTPADIEAPTVEYVAFYHRRTGKALPIEKIPDVIFSEIMRDVDMAVSVAHAGSVDPQTSHSTVEMRAAILNFTLPLLRLENVSIQGSHAIIEGSLGKYSVHLGIGVVHQIGGTMLNVLPVHSQHRGRIFLPFADDDPKTAEIISKVILFSEDRKLKDPTILCQIIR